MNPERWALLMVSLGLRSNQATYGELKAAYSESHRHYHTLQHIDACLEHLDKVKPLANYPEEIALALWFHDAVYKPMSNDNEVESAEWATSFLSKNKCSDEQIRRIEGLILSTRHEAPTSTHDESIMVDIDLSILGAQPKEYQAFEESIRKEYKLVPKPIYWRKRKKLLKGFIDRARIYQNGFFHDMLEEQARKNIANVLAS